MDGRIYTHCIQFTKIPLKFTSHACFTFFFLKHGRRAIANYSNDMLAYKVAFISDCYRHYECDNDKHGQRRQKQDERGGDIIELAMWERGDTHSLSPCIPE